MLFAMRRICLVGLCFSVISIALGNGSKHILQGQGVLNRLTGVGAGTLGHLLNQLNEWHAVGFVEGSGNAGLNFESSLIEHFYDGLAREPSQMCSVEQSAVLVPEVAEAQSDLK